MSEQITKQDIQFALGYISGLISASELLEIVLVRPEEDFIVVSDRPRRKKKLAVVVRPWSGKEDA